MPHTAVLTSSLWSGAIQRTFLNLASELGADGDRVDLVTCHLDPAGPRAARISPQPVFEIGGWAARRAWMLRHKRRYVTASVFQLAAYLRRERPDALLSGGKHVNLIAVWARQLAGVDTRIVISEHTHLSASLRARPSRSPSAFPALARATYRHADAVVGVSEGVADDLEQAFAVPRERLHAIPNPVVTPALLRAARQRSAHPWYGGGQPPVILSVAALRPQKDHATLLRAFQLVRCVRPARLVLIGEGAQRRSILARIERMGLRDDVQLTGFVENPLRHMSQASVLALSSIYEGLGNVLIEALLCGCPVVSTDCPSGPSEILERGRLGRLVPVGDPEAMAWALLEVLEKPPSGERGRRRALDYDAGRIALRYKELLWNRRSDALPRPLPAVERKAAG